MTESEEGRWDYTEDKPETQTQYNDADKLERARLRMKAEHNQLDNEYDWQKGEELDLKGWLDKTFPTEHEEPIKTYKSTGDFLKSVGATEDSTISVSGPPAGDQPPANIWDELDEAEEDFKEEEHPREETGKFTGKGGGSTGSKPEQPKEKRFTLKQYQRNEDVNNHDKNALMLVKQYGTPEEVKEIEDILKRNKDGYSGVDGYADYQRRYEISNKYYDNLEKEGGKANEEFREEDHPRDGGKFTTKGGGDSGAKSEQPKEKKEEPKRKLIGNRQGKWYIDDPIKPEHRQNLINDVKSRINRLQNDKDKETAKKKIDKVDSMSDEELSKYFMWMGGRPVGESKGLEFKPELQGKKIKLQDGTIKTVQSVGIFSDDVITTDNKAVMEGDYELIEESYGQESQWNVHTITHGVIPLTLGRQAEEIDAINAVKRMHFDDGFIDDRDILSAVKIGEGRVSPDTYYYDYSEYWKKGSDYQRAGLALQAGIPTSWADTEWNDLPADIQGKITEAGYVTSYESYKEMSWEFLPDKIKQKIGEVLFRKITEADWDGITQEERRKMLKESGIENDEQEVALLSQLLDNELEEQEAGHNEEEDIAIIAQLLGEEEFREQEHPREDSGKFTSKGGGGSTGSKYDKMSTKDIVKSIKGDSKDYHDWGRTEKNEELYAEIERRNREIPQPTSKLPDKVFRDDPNAVKKMEQKVKYWEDQKDYWDKVIKFPSRDYHTPKQLGDAKWFMGTNISTNLRDAKKKLEGIKAQQGRGTTLVRKPTYKDGKKRFYYSEEPKGEPPEESWQKGGESKKKAIELDDIYKQFTDPIDAPTGKGIMDNTRGYTGAEEEIIEKTPPKIEYQYYKQHPFGVRKDSDSPYGNEVSLDTMNQAHIWWDNKYPERQWSDMTIGERQRVILAFLRDPDTALESEPDWNKDCPEGYSWDKQEYKCKEDKEFSEEGGVGSGRKPFASKDPARKDKAHVGWKNQGIDNYLDLATKDYDTGKTSSPDEYEYAGYHSSKGGEGMLAIGNNEPCPYCGKTMIDGNIDGQDAVDHFMDKHPEEFDKALFGGEGGLGSGRKGHQGWMRSIEEDPAYGECKNCQVITEKVNGKCQMCGKKY